jgi:hypothetical protein
MKAFYSQIHPWLEWWFRLGRINISKRQFMIINGLGPEDMKNDITYP